MNDSKWTVMVFMGAATIAGNVPLIDAADADIAEMESVGSGGRLNIFVQVHGKTAIPQRSHIGIQPMRDVPRGQDDPTHGRALESFIRWALTKSRHRIPNDYSMLVLWGHAYDFAFGRERTRSGTIDALDFAELSKLLERLQQRFGPAKLDVLGFDACDLATVEMACQLEPFANYLLGSEIGIPIPGWPYDRILDRLRNPQRDLMSPPDLGSYVVRRFCESYVAKDPVSLSLLDLSRATDLFAHAEALADTLASAIVDSDARRRIARLFWRSQTGEGRPYVDVADLCLTLVRESGNAFVEEAAKRLGDFLISPQLSLDDPSANGARQPFIVDCGRNAGNTARLNGVSIYAPHVALSNDFDSVRHLYQNFDFVQDTRWSELVHALARLR